MVNPANEPDSRWSQMFDAAFRDDEKVTLDDASLSAILKHELETPVEFELGLLSPEHQFRLRRVATGQNLLLKDLGTLLTHPHPPLELLVLTKEFAKANQHGNASGLPRPVAIVIYIAAICVALTRHNKRITSMTNERLLVKIGWVLDCVWLPASLRPLFEATREQLARGGD